MAGTSSRDIGSGKRTGQAGPGLPGAQRDDWYRHPSWYDILHAPGTAGEVTGLERIERRFSNRPLGRARTWLEPACGTGRYLRVAAARGRRVVGIDLGEEMIAYARASFARRGLRGRFVLGDITRFRLPVRVDFAFCLINSLRHLPSDEAMLAHFACMARALKLGAVYAVGLECSRYGRQFPSEDVWEGRRGPVRVQQVVQYRPPSARTRREGVFSHLTVTSPRTERHLDSVYDLRSYSEAEWSRLVARSAMREIGRCDPDGEDCLTGPAGVVGGYAVRVLSPR